MSEKYRAIIRSSEAEAFLRMVTKGFYDNSYTGLWIYEVIGREWDDMRAWAEGLKNEIHPQTCTWSVGIWEWVYGIETDESLALDLRRKRILAKIIGTKPINPEVIRRGTAALAGIPANNVQVKDFTAPYQFAVSLCPTRGMVPYDKIAVYLYQIKPAHLHTQISVSVETAKPLTLHLGGGYGSGAQFGLRETPDKPEFCGTLRTGGRIAALSAKPVPENRTAPTATTILRTGGVITILSNISKGN